MNILVKNAKVMDPSQGIDGICDIMIENGKIKEVRKRGSLPAGQVGAEAPKKTNTEFSTSELPGCEVIDAEGQLVIPGLVDMHVHLREPGFAYKETIATGTEAAVRGGITTVCCMPNTNPVNDNAGITEFIINRAAREGSCSVYPVGAITKGQKGEELAELSIMREAGCIAFSDDGRPVMDSLLMRRALEYSKILDALIISHCEDLSLAAGGVMNEGQLSVTLGLKGLPPQAEEIMVSRDIALAELTGGRLHIAHVSTAGSVEIIRAAKKRGVADVTAETCPHYFHLTEETARGYNTFARVNPPLRTKADVEAVRQGLADNTLDVIATDHAPHHIDEKMVEFDNAPSGISGLETSLGLSMKLVEEGILGLPQLIEKMTLNPSRILGLLARGTKGTLRPGADADLVIVNTDGQYRVAAGSFRSKGKNSPFDGWALKTGPVITISNGRIFRWE